MATKTIAWNSGSGNITLTYGGQGDGTITIESADNNLYEARSQEIVIQTTAGSPQITRTITITQAAKMRIDLSAAIVTAANQTYSGSAKTPVPTVILDGETVPSTGYDVTYSNNTNAGTATVTVTGKGDYTGTANGTFTIAKANPVYVAPTANNRTYNTSSAALLVAGSNTTPGTFTYCATQSGTYSTTIPSQTNAGTYTTYWKFTPTDSNNYNSVGATAVSTTISPKTVSSPTITLSQDTYTYSGSTCQPIPTVKDGTVTISSSEYTVSYSNNTNVGTATVAITDKSGGNYTVSGSTTFTINKADPTYTAPTAQSLTYTGSSQYLITTGSTSHGTIQYSANGSSWSTTRPSQTNAGTYTAYWRLVGDSNHNDVASTQISNVGIAQKALTITAKAQSVTYGTAISQSTSQVTSTGLVSGHSVTAITLTQSTTNVTTTGTITPSAATIKQSSTDVTANYSITYNTGTLTITAATPVYTAPTAKSLTYSGSSQSLINAGSSTDGTFTYKLSTASSYSSSIPTGTNAGGYTVNWKFVADANHGGGTETGNVSVTIAQKSLTIAAKAQSISYGGSIATGTSRVTTSGLVSGDTLTAITLTASTSDVTTSGTITPSAASTTKGINNYSVTYNTGNLTITAVPASVTTAPTAKTLSYTGSAQALVNAGTADGGTMYYQMTTTNSRPTSTSDFSTAIPTGTNAGSAYYVWYYVKGDSNHTDTAISSTAVNVTISKVAPTYTAPTATGWTYSRSAQYLISTGSTSHGTIQYSSDGTNWSTTRPQGTNAGTYTSYWRLVGDTNHTDVSKTSISTTVAKRTPVVATAPAKATNLVYTGSAQDLLTGGSMKFSSSDSTAVAGTFTYKQGMNAATYSSLTWSFTPTDTTNYNSKSGTVSGSVVIAKADPVYTAPVANNLTYNRANQPLLTAGSTSDGTIQYSSNGTSWSSTTPSQKDAGTYTVYWKLNGDSNHNSVSSTSISVTIEKCTPVINVSPTIRTGLTYSGSAKNLLQGGSMKHSSTDSTSVTGTFTYQQEINAGSYVNPTWSFTPTGSYATNYNSTSGYVEGTASIAKAAPTYTWPQKVTGLTYTGEPQALVTAGSTSDGVMYYALTNSDPDAWSLSVPTATNAGRYDVHFKIVGDANHTDITGLVQSILIQQAEGYITVHPVANELTYNGTAQVCATSGSGSGTYMFYKLSTSINTSQTPPGVTDAGDYIMEYYTGPSADGNYTRSATYSLAIHVDKASRTISFVNPPQRIQPFESITLETSVSAGSSDGTITITSSDSNTISVNGTTITGAVSGSATITATISGGTNYNDASTSTTIIADQAPQFVDLALPSNVLWARGNMYKAGSSYLIANIIVESSNTYDLYFSWGNIVGYPGQSNERIIGYSFTEEAYASTPGASLTGDIPAGDTTYDAPAALLGSGARLPSSTEVQELLQYTTAEPYVVNGIQGALLTSTLNGNKIFIPLSGYATSNIINSKGMTAWYHTSTYGQYNARMLFVDYVENDLYLALSSDSKYHGTLIRPVKDNPVHNFEYTGEVQSVSLRAGTYRLECWGAQGGSYDTTKIGGKGAKAEGTLTLSTTTTLYIYVGGQGAGGTAIGTHAGGFNGGGNAYTSSSSYVCEGGGGASDIRIGTDSLYARVIVAGGGGGVGSTSSSTHYNGGSGGGSDTGGTGSGSTSYKGGTGGTQTAGGTSYYGTNTGTTSYGVVAAFGVGGGAKNSTYQIAGAGGGWYGGGYARRAGGGGGSSYVYTSSTASKYPSGCLLNSNYYLTSASRFTGNQNIPSPSGEYETGHTGNGYIRITKL